MLGILSSIISGIISPITKVFERKLDVDLEKYKVDGHLNEQLVQAAMVELQAQAQSQTTLFGDRLMRYLFVYPLGVYWAAVIADKLTETVTPWHWDVLALTSPLDEWAGWMIMYLFLHSSIVSVLKR